MFYKTYSLEEVIVAGVGDQGGLAVLIEAAFQHEAMKVGVPA